MKNKKVYLTCTFLMAVLGISSIAFSTYVITQGTFSGGEATVEVSKIDVKEKVQKFLSFNNVSRKIKLYDSAIVDDVYSLSFNFNQYYYANRNVADQELSRYSGIKAEITFDKIGDNTLYDYVKNSVGLSFIDVSYNDYYLRMDENYNYTCNEMSSLSYDDATKKCIFHLSFSDTVVNNHDFYLDRLAIDNKLTNANSVNDNWNFNLNFNFYIVDEYLGFAQNFNKDTFGTVKINISFEAY